ncbi:hypothetical protein K6U70_09825, partial [Vibrio vulnificus]|nr:hypothetical protein [Vibrio vulnificus]
MNQRSKKLTWTFVTLLVLFFLFWGAKTYSENYRVKAEKELDHVHGELQVDGRCHGDHEPYAIALRP